MRAILKSKSATDRRPFGCAFATMEKAFVRSFGPRPRGTLRPSGNARTSQTGRRGTDHLEPPWHRNGNRLEPGMTGREPASQLAGAHDPCESLSRSCADGLVEAEWYRRAGGGADRRPLGKWRAP